MKQDETNEQDATPDETGPSKKRYEKPSIIYREPLEAVASSCLAAPGKSGPAEMCEFASS